MTQVNTLAGTSAKDVIDMLANGTCTQADALARANAFIAKGVKGFRLRNWNAVVAACGGTPTPAPAQEDTRTADAIAQAQVAFANAPAHFLTRAKAKLATGKGILTREEKIALVKALG
jgi:hypothetical protein